MPEAYANHGLSAYPGRVDGSVVAGILAIRGTPEALDATDLP
jgi:hypothetical protein